MALPRSVAALALGSAAAALGCDVEGFVSNQTLRGSSAAAPDASSGQSPATGADPSPAAQPTTSTPAGSDTTPTTSDPSTSTPTTTPTPTPTPSANACSATTDTYSSYIKALFDMRCASCHGQLYGSLESIALSQAKIRAAIESTTRPMPPPPGSFTDDERKRVVTWLDCPQPLP